MEPLRHSIKMRLGTGDSQSHRPTLSEASRVRNASQQPDRRDVLAIAAGLGISFVLPGMDLKAAEQRGPERQKSLLTLWLAGGPSQLETWDPHPGMKIGGPTKAIATSIPGVQIAEFYPQLAEQLGHISVIRSLWSKEGDHARGTYYLKTGYRPDPTLRHPSVGAIASYALPDPTVEIPMNVALGSSPFSPGGGYLGAEHDAFRVFDPGRNLQNLQAYVGDARQRQRLESLDVVSQAFRAGRSSPAARTLHQETVAAALKMMTSEQLKAFTLDDEPKRILTAYGDSPFGRGCLVARRLIERGVRSVEVSLGGFDSHASNFEAHQRAGTVLDPAFAQLLRDLKARDLLDSTVVLCIGEFGRTPNINPLEGRDHWPGGFSCLLGGGGLKSGVLIGETDSAGIEKVPKDQVEIKDLYATILQALGIDYGSHVDTPVGRPMKLSDGTPLKRLV